MSRKFVEHSKYKSDEHFRDVQNGRSTFGRKSNMQRTSVGCELLSGSRISILSE